MKARHFVGELLDGHNGAAGIVPFDPAKEWGTDAVEHGVMPWRVGQLVQGEMNGAKFAGWIGHRWGRFFLLVDEDLQTRAGITIGDMVPVIVEPRTLAAAPKQAAPVRPTRKPKKAAR